MTQPQHPARGTMFSVAVTVKPGCIHQPGCTPSLAAAVGTTAFTMVRARSLAAITLGTCTRALACGAFVIVCKSAWVAERPPVRMVA